MQLHWIALLPLVFQVSVAEGAELPAPLRRFMSDSSPRSYDVMAREYSRKLAKKKHERSTSSSSGERAGSGASGDSLGISESSVESSDEKKHVPGEPQGWRKWHRTCTSCPKDMLLKWRDPSVSWICGAYQRARRSFKSECMMQYRNCQDGTMFVKIADQRCNDKAPGYNGGRHFFYDYPVDLPDDSSSRSTQESSEATYSDSSSSD